MLRKSYYVLFSLYPVISTPKLFKNSVVEYIYVCVSMAVSLEMASLVASEGGRSHLEHEQEVTLVGIECLTNDMGLRWDKCGYVGDGAILLRWRSNGISCCGGWRQ
ncbi:hypothetical protein L6452_39454 [Arctium lappa]|uniref:Uncharacterized protein n=1 Tax=Arctium lappa TaxID=4217 RepID=A0ACB8XU13_ARCLA|nr:hypothetical protein L6452_39454 [Arctium lappa]